MVKPQVDAATGDTLPPFGIINDKDGYYKQYRTDDMEQDAIYIIKADGPFNSEAHSNIQTQLNTGKLKFLIDERTAQLKLLSKKAGQNMSQEERTNYLKPFQLTSILREELLNLKETSEDNINIKLKQANRMVGKDKFSSLEYGLMYIKTEEENKKRKKRFKASDWSFLN